MHTQHLITIGFCIFMYITLSAAPSKLESNSPFLPPGYNSRKPVAPKPVPQPNSPLARDLEFRGVVQLNGVYQFSLFKKSENKGYWIPENGSENGVSVSNFDADGMHIVVTLNGRSEQLTLLTASDSPIPLVAAQGCSVPQDLDQDQAKAPSQAPVIPTLSNTKSAPTQRRRTIPRRRVIVPPKR